MTDISPDAAEVQAARTLLALEDRVVVCYHCLKAGRGWVPATRDAADPPWSRTSKTRMCDMHADAMSAWWDVEADRR